MVVTVREYGTLALQCFQRWRLLFAPGGKESDRDISFDKIRGGAHEGLQFARRAHETHALLRVECICGGWGAWICDG